MKFRKLKLAAFVSFKDKTEIDFKQFGNKLMLLFGGSGVGKTAIFDGITFALYGRGSGKDRCAGKIEDYHSDFAKELDDKGNIVYHAPMLVELEFEHDGNVYTATREIKWGENGKNKGFTYEMELKCGTDVVVSDTKKGSNGTLAGNFIDKVSARIMEMLGLNADQFSQVVILAQGEFAKFLNANAQEREEILTKLVDNEAYVDFQLRLKDLRNHLKNIIEDIDDEIEHHLDVLRSRASISDAEKEQYKVVDEQLLTALEDNLQTKVKQIEDLQKEIEENENKVSDLNKQKGAVDEQNKSFDEKSKQLKETEENLKNLKARIDIDFWEKVLEDVLKLQEILPKHEAKCTAADELSTNEATIRDLKKAIEKLEKQEVDLGAAKDAAEEENKPKISVLEGTILKLEGALKVYPVLKAAEDRLSELKEELEAATEKAEAAKNAYNKEQEGKAECEKKLLALGNAVAQKTELDGQLKEAKQQVEALKGLHKAIKETNSKLSDYEAKQQLEKEAEAYKETCLKAYDSAQQAYYLAEQKFQSGSIANKVREHAEKQKLTDVECPVCHTIHKVEALGQWESCEELPEKTALEQADSDYKKALRGLTTAISETSASKATYEAEMKNTMNEAKVLLGDGVLWDDLKNLKNPNNTLVLELQQKQELKNDLQKAFDEAKNKAEEQTKLQRKQQEINEQVPKLKTKWDASVEVMEKAKQLVEEKKTEVAKQEGMLAGCPLTQKEADLELTKAKNAKAALQKQINDATADYNTCVNTMSNDKGKLQQAQDSHQSLQDKLQSCEKNYKDVLTNCHLSEEEFSKIHDTRKDKNGDKLTGNNVAEAAKNTRKYVTDYKSEEAKYLHAIESLTTELQDKKHIDTTELVATIDTLNAELEACKATQDSLKTDRDFNEQTLTKVTKCFKNRIKKQKVYRVIEPLADAANGSITFNRYVLEDLFCAMLDKANDRLSVLCSGQYELKPIEEGVAKKNKGLGFTVYDCINQSHRESGANSGGEKFEISLSLALGLSDIVQSCSKKASRIESLFIDEGFGTLGKEELEKTKRLLLELSGGSRQIGIISHNPVLEEAIKNQIVVDRDKQTRSGTKITFNLDC